MNLTKSLKLFIFFTLCSVLGIAQEKQRLVDVIDVLENRFEVKFSYAVKDVRAIMVHRPDEVDSLKSIIENLNNTTLLSFRFLTERYITISIIDKTIEWAIPDS